MSLFATQTFFIYGSDFYFRYSRNCKLLKTNESEISVQRIAVAGVFQVCARRFAVVAAFFFAMMRAAFKRIHGLGLPGFSFCAAKAGRDRRVSEISSLVFQIVTFFVIALIIVGAACKVFRQKAEIPGALDNLCFELRPRCHHQ